jgi:HSP20 family molecular chaperone IbpA
MKYYTSYTGLVDFFDSLSNNYYEDFTFKCKDNQDEYILTLPLPGYVKENLDISYKKKDYNYDIIIELKESTDFLHKGTYSYRVNKDADIKTAKASLEDGILKIVIKKDVTQTDTGRIVL